MEKIDTFLNQLKTEKMEAIITSPELQEKIDYVLGKAQGYIPYSAIKARLEKQPADLQKEIVNSEEFNNYSLDYVLGNTQKDKIPFPRSSYRVSQLDQPTKGFVLNSEAFRELALNYVLANGQESKISLSAAKKRIELLPEELRVEMMANPKVQATYPGIV